MQSVLAQILMLRSEIDDGVLNLILAKVKETWKLVL